MLHANDAFNQIKNEILSDQVEVRDAYAKHFTVHAERFAAHMADAFVAWRDLDERIGKHETLTYVSALVFTAITLSVQSMTALFAGHLVAAGNLSRQVVESIALALLCSSSKLTTLQLFIDDKYSTNKAVDQAAAQAETLGVMKDAIQELQKAQAFYHMYSHPTKSTIATVVSVSGQALYVGAAFDDDKLAIYTKEVEGRVSLAGTFVSFIVAVRRNVEGW